MAGVQKVRLNNLNVNLKNALIIGIIIAKNSPRVFNSKKKNKESRGVLSFTLRDSNVDTINCDVWGSEYFVSTFYERYLIGDVVEITSPKISIKNAENEQYRPQVSSPFHLSLNEGTSEMVIHGGDTFAGYLPLLHIPTKPSAGFCSIADVLKMTESTDIVHVDLLVLVKSVEPVKNIRTKTGTEMSVRNVELMDNTTPATLSLNIFDSDTIRRAGEWRALESVLFIADARVSWRARGVSATCGARTVVTHQPLAPHAAHLRALAAAPANHHGSAAAWEAWGGCEAAGSVARVRARLGAARVPFCATLRAVLTHMDLDDLLRAPLHEKSEGLRVRFADHTGELNAMLPVDVLEDTLKCYVDQIRAMPEIERAALRWSVLLETCVVKLAASPPRLTVLSLRKATSADPIPLY